LPRAHDFTDVSSLFYSVVIPVYRSAEFLSDTVNRTLDYFRSKGWKCEIVLVNDASPDDSWAVIEELARAHPEVVGVDLLKNAGQHNANFIGLEHVSGDVVITMDDDLQNPPEEIEKLAACFVEGHDLVVGRFEQKRHSGFRRLGSEFVQWINRRIFPAPEGFRHSNFRMIGRAVVERMLSYATHYPYTSGLAVRMARSPANVTVRHDDRIAGESNYNMRKLVALTWSIVFNYSLMPLRLLIAVGLSLSVLFGLFAIFYLLRGLVTGSAVPGWTTIMVFMALSNSLLFLLLSIMGEYIGGIMQVLVQKKRVFVSKVVRHGASD